MGALMAVEALALAVLGLLVVGLLRSHAEILRQLHDLGAGEHGHDGHDGHGRPAAVTLSPPSPRTSGEQAPAIVGVTPFDEAVTIAPGAGAGAGAGTVLAFLTTGCTSCLAFWDALKAPQSQRVVIVTRGPGDESVGSARRLAGPKPSVDVVMSSEAWADYGVPGAPYFVQVDGTTGRVTGEGTARTWDQVLHLLEEAGSDDVDDGPAGPWSTDAEREARIDRELENAGILPGDPRLYHET